MGHRACSETLTLCPLHFVFLSLVEDAAIIAKKPETAQYLICFIFTNPCIPVYNADVSKKLHFLRDQNLE
jgi:hypothetical protein